MRQSAFALVGDLSCVCAPHLQPVMKQLLALAIQNMESHCIILQNMSACNNACWSMGTLLSCTLCCAALTHCGMPACIFDAVMIGLSHMAYPNGCWHTITFLPRLRHYPVRGHGLNCLLASACRGCLPATTPAGLRARQLAQQVCQMQLLSCTACCDSPSQCSMSSCIIL